MKKMNANLLLLALLVFSNYNGSQARAIDDIDNSIVPADIDLPPPSSSMSHLSRSRIGTDWIKFTKAPPAKVLQTLGSTVEIVCEVMGSQIPTIHWVEGHTPLSEIEDFESNVITESNSNSIVEVRSIHVIDHMLREPHTYTCVGRTGSKTIYASTTVYPQTDLKDLIQIRDKPFKAQYKPRIVYNEKVHLELQGTNAVLPCKVHARPMAEIFWMNDDGHLIEQNQRYKLLPSGDLLIANLKWEDMGTYKCFARNALGKDTADTFIYPIKRDDK